MRTTYHESFKVRSYETDVRGRLQAPILCQFLEEAAVAHAALIGVAVEELIENGIAWVLSRLHLEMGRWPAADEEIVIETWPEAASRLFTERRFEVLDSSKRRIGTVSTLWLVLDLERRRPVRLPPQVLDRLHEHELGSEPRKFGDLVAPNPIQHELGFTVRRSDLDLAHHVNNTSYVEWAVEAVPDAAWSEKDLAELDIHYLSECHHGQTVLSRSQVVDQGKETEVRHQLMRHEDGTEVARARTLWRGGKGEGEKGRS
jgi:medium-chain acyl-[acyl-carrier-protein] hydrolase